MMKIFLSVVSISFILGSFIRVIESSNDNWNCSKADAIASFKKKILVNQYPFFKNDPYQNQTEASLNEINSTLSNLDIVCAIQYTSSSKNEYTIRNFPDKNSALGNNHIVTHQGRCGACSNLNDLSVYLSTNLTSPTRKCGMIGALSEAQVIEI